MGWDADSALLARAGAQVTAVGGCCGLAGNFGVERGHYDVSRAVAETALLPAVRAAPDAAASADAATFFASEATSAAADFAWRLRLAISFLPLPACAAASCASRWALT